MTLDVSQSVVDVLRDQHRQVAELFDRVSEPDEDRPVVLHDLLRELAAHVAAERSSVPPLVGETAISGELHDALMDDYDRIEKLMVLIERRKFNSPDVPDLVIQLRDATRAHIGRADEELFPALDTRLSEARKLELGDTLRDEEDMVTSHPHPHLLSLGPVADVLTKVASRWDRLRDRTVNNRQPEPRRHL